MEKKSSPFMPSLNYGIIYAIIGILISVIVWATGLQESLGLMGSLTIGIFNLVVLLILLIIFTKAYRDKTLDRKITYGQAFVFGLLVVIVGTIISAIYNYIFNNYIDPEYMQRIMTGIQEKTLNMMAERGVPDDAIEQTMAKFEEQGVPDAMQMVKQTLMGGVIGGAIMSLISSAIVKKDNTLNA